jgi:8-oxo-dGTP diphosphatase
MDDDDINTYDPLTVGSKGPVYVGEQVIVYRRSKDAPTNPGELDLPGGGPEAQETPFETFKREVYEEFGLEITREHIAYARRYPSVFTPGKFGWFVVAKLPAEAKDSIVFGDEGDEYMLMTDQAFLARTDAWAFLQDRTRDYLKSIAP